MKRLNYIGNLVLMSSFLIIIPYVFYGDEVIKEYTHYPLAVGVIFLFLGIAIKTIMFKIKNNESN